MLNIIMINLFPSEGQSLRSATKNEVLGFIHFGCYHRRAASVRMVCYHELLMCVPHLVPVRTLPVTYTASAQCEGCGSFVSDSGTDTLQAEDQECFSTRHDG